MAKRLRNESDLTSKGSKRPRNAEASGAVDVSGRVTGLFNAAGSRPIPLHEFISLKCAKGCVRSVFIGASVVET